MWQKTHTTDTAFQDTIQENMTQNSITNFAEEEITQAKKQTNETYIEAYRKELRTLYYRNIPTITSTSREKQTTNNERENTTHKTMNNPNNELKNLIKNTQQINELIKSTNLTRNQKKQSEHTKIRKNRKNRKNKVTKKMKGT